MVSVQELQQAADKLGVNWLSSALQGGYMDGKAGREKTPLGVCARLKGWRELYDESYALGQKARGE